MRELEFTKKVMQQSKVKLLNVGNIYEPIVGNRDSVIQYEIDFKVKERQKKFFYKKNSPTFVFLKAKHTTGLRKFSVLIKGLQIFEYLLLFFTDTVMSSRLPASC